MIKTKRTTAATMRRGMTNHSTRQQQKQQQKHRYQHTKKLWFVLTFLLGCSTELYYLYSTRNDWNVEPASWEMAMADLPTVSTKPSSNAPDQSNTLDGDDESNTTASRRHPRKAGKNSARRTDKDKFAKRVKKEKKESHEDDERRRERYRRYQEKIKTKFVEEQMLLPKHQNMTHNELYQQLFVHLDPAKAAKTAALIAAAAADGEDATDYDGNSIDDIDPWFVLHIGPPKTATTTIQCALEKYSLRLAKTDDYHYLGGGCGVPRFEYWYPNGETALLPQQIMFGLKPNSQNPHRLAFVERLRTLRSHGKSVVVSSELFGKALRDDTTLHEINALITDPIVGAGFTPDKVRIVLAYRHFCDWLPSYFYQKNLMVGDNQWLKKTNPAEERVKPFLEYLDKYVQVWDTYREILFNGTLSAKGSDDPDELLLEFLPKGMSIHPTWFNYVSFGKHFPGQIQVLDIHAPLNGNRPHDDVPTDFVCHMLPTAHRTCAKLRQLVDEKAKASASHNGTTTVVEVNDTAATIHRGEDNVEEPDYDNLQLHSKFSYLHPKRADGVHSDASAKSGGNNSTQGMTFRTSSDFHGARIIEAYLIDGDIPEFDFTNYGEDFFADESLPHSATSRDSTKGYTKTELIQYVEELLETHNIRAPDERYFDCLSGELEERFVNASWSFLDMIYTLTPMLSRAAELTLSSAGTTATIREARMAEEEEKRYLAAREDHARVYEKNKAKGKYCDASPAKIKANAPEIYQALTSLSYKKPWYRAELKRMTVPEHVLALMKELDWHPKMGHGRNHFRPKPLAEVNWAALTPKQKSAAFALGYTANKWDGIDTVEEQQDQDKQEGEEEGDLEEVGEEENDLDDEGEDELE